MNKDDKLMMVVLVSVRHRELAAVLVAVGEGEGDDVVARLGDVD